jgi:hypothetical protein
LEALCNRIQRSEPKAQRRKFLQRPPRRPSLLSGQSAVEAKIFTMQRIGWVKIVNYEPRDRIVVVEAPEFIKSIFFARHNFYIP